jgi:hypothetical protein
MTKFEDIHEAQIADYWSKHPVKALKSLRNVKSHPDLLHVWWRLIAANKKLEFPPPIWWPECLP